MSVPKSLTLLLALALAGVACEAEVDGLVGNEKAGLAPPKSRLFFPTGLALTPDGRYLFVTNGNADLRYNGGSISVVDVQESVARILAPTATEKNNLLTHYNAPAGKIGVVPCGVNLDLFQPIDRTAARQRLGFNDNESIVLYVGRFDPIKGIDRLLKAATHLQDHTRLRLVIIGGDGPDTPEYQNLQKMTRKLGLQNTVTFVGRIEQSHLPPYYSAADVLVMPSYYESFGLVGLESLACGTPVVATEVGAMQSILRNGETGRTVADADPRSLAQAIETFITRPGSGKLSTDRIRASVLKFGWANVAGAVIDEYEILFKQMDFKVTDNPSAKVSSL